jgi:hypothetical protein
LAAMMKIGRSAQQSWNVLQYCRRSSKPDGPPKKPLHIIIPGMVLSQSGRLIGPFGVMGGHYQATGHVDFLRRILLQKHDPQTAINMSRTFAAEGVLRVGQTLESCLRAGLKCADTNCLNGRGLSAERRPSSCRRADNCGRVGSRQGRLGDCPVISYRFLGGVKDCSKRNHRQKRR